MVELGVGITVAGVTIALYFLFAVAALNELMMPDFGLFNYWMVIVLMMAGLYVVMARSNLVKKIIGLSVFQSAVIMFYVSMAKVAGGTAPILPRPTARSFNDPSTRSIPTRCPTC